MPLENSFGDGKLEVDQSLVTTYVCCELRVRASAVRADLWWEFDVG